TLTLFLESDQHLDQDTAYLLVVTGGVRDASGDPIEASEDFLEFRRDLNFGQTKDAQLKFYREVLIRALAGDVLGGVSRHIAAAASVFTTGGVTSTLEKIREQIKAASAPLVSLYLVFHGAHTVLCSVLII